MPARGEWTYLSLREHWKSMQSKGHFTARHAFLSFHVLTAAGSHTSVTNELAPSHQQPFFFADQGRESQQNWGTSDVGSSRRHMTSVPAVTWRLDKKLHVFGEVLTSIGVSNRDPVWWHYCLTTWEFALDSLPTSRKPGREPPSHIPRACFYITSTALSSNDALLLF